MDNTKKEKICNYILNNEKTEYQKIIEKENDIDIFLALSNLRKNIINWYEFKENSEVLEIGGNFGEITELLCSKVKNVTSVEEDKDKIQAIKSRCSEYNNLSVVSNIEEIGRKKFDYIIIINESKFKFDFNLLKEYLNVDGIVIITTNNKFGIKNINSTKEIEDVNYEKHIVEKIKNSNFKNYHIYYMFNDYKIPNIIFDKDYILSREDLTRNFKYSKVNETVYKREDNILSDLYDIDKEIIPFFANSLFIEISNNTIESNNNVIFFNSYRKDEFQLITKIEKNETVKKIPANKLSQKHIENIKENIEKFNFKGCKILDKSADNFIWSNFITENEKFDEELLKIEEIDEFILKFKEYINVLYNSSKEFDEKNVNSSLKFISKDILSKFKYLDNAYIDMIPKNCFKINGEFCFFDQEWRIENFPVEFIIYRAILNMVSLSNEKKERIFRELNLFEILDVLQLIEKEFFDNKINEYNLFSIFYKEPKILIEEYDKFFKELDYKDLKIEELREEVEKEKEKINELRGEIQKNREQINGLNMQLQIISKSKSWKLTKPLRYFSEKILTFKKNKKDIIIYPVRKAIINLNISKYKKITDIQTARYWIDLEKRLEKFKANFLPKDEYEIWVKNNSVTNEELKKQKKTKFKYNPKISIIIPLYNTPVKFFRELLYTVEKQTYSNWELCLADGSKEKNLEIEKMCLKDERIKYEFIGQNKGISGNTNEALKLATGDYIALLDHDDLLTLDSLYEVVKEINKNPELKFIYTDEDKISEIDQPRYSPHFKPDFAPDFFRSNNYICHFSFFRKDVMEQLKGFRDDYNGAQDFDIILRMTEIVDKKHIKHIPKILYHWRVHRDSTASKPEAKPYAYLAGKKAVQDHIDRMNLPGKSDIEKKLLGVYKIDYSILKEDKITIFVYNNYSSKITEQCIKSIKNKTTYNNYEIKPIEGIDDMYMKLNNDIKQCGTEYVVILDSNCIINTPDWLEKLLAFTQRKDVGISSLKIVNENNSIKHAGIYWGVNGFIGYPCRNQPSDIFGYCARESTIGNMNIVTDECMMIKKSIFNEIGGFDETLTTASYIDLCLKVREKDYLIVYEPHAKLLSVSSDYKTIIENDVEKVKNMWKDKIVDDCYYNKNLTNLKTLYNIN